MGTIAGDYNRQHSVNRRKSPATYRSVSSGYVHLATLLSQVIKIYLNSIELPEMNYKHFREKNAKFHIFLLLSIMGGISLITIYDRKFRHNRPEEGLPKIITFISPINPLWVCMEIFLQFWIRMSSLIIKIKIM